MLNALISLFLNEGVASIEFSKIQWMRKTNEGGYTKKSSLIPRLKVIVITSSCVPACVFAEKFSECKSSSTLLPRPHDVR